MPELRRFIRITGGVSSQIRKGVLTVDHLALAWIYGPAAERDYWPPNIDVLVISDREKRIGQLPKSESWPKDRIDLKCIRRSDWIRRLKQKEMEAWRLRRGTKTWLIGSDEELRRMEEHEVSARRTWEMALANWRDEYEWDDDWDPAQHGRPLI